MSDALLPVVSYRRISSDKSGRAVGVEDQAVQIDDLVEFGGYEITLVGDYCDPSVSADKQRPEFDRLWRDVESGRVRGIVCRDFDRLFRDDAQWALFTKMLERKRRVVHLYFVKEGPIVVDPIGRPGDLLLPGIKAQIAQHELRLIKSRALGFHARRRRAGVVSPTMQRRYGYTRAMEVVPEEAAMIRRMAALVLDGRSLRSIATLFNSEGVPTTDAEHKRAQGREPLWYASTIRSTLLRPDVAGLVSRRSKERDAHYEIEGEAVHEKILDIETWRECRRAMGGDKAKRRRSNSRLLAGLAVDVDLVRLTTGSNRGVAVYRSQADGTGVKGGRRRVQMPAERLEGIVVDALLDRSKRMPLVEASVDSSEADRLRDELASIDDRSNALAKRYAEGRLTDEALDEANDVFVARRRVIHAALAHVDERLDDDLLDLLRSKGRLAKAWTGGLLDVEQKRRVLHALIAQVIVAPAAGCERDVDRVLIVPVEAIAERWQAAA